MTRMSAPTGEKPSLRKKVLVTLSIVVMGAVIIIAFVGSQYHPTPTPSPYVEVDYKTVGWYYTYPLSNNQSCVVLNLTVTNEGYAEGVEYNWENGNPNSFSLNISNVVGTLVIVPLVCIANSSSPSGYSTVGNWFSYSELLNGYNDTGTIIFEFPKQLYNQPFTLRCSMSSVNGIHKTVNVKISGS
jgi:hypothetical protein